MQGDIKYFHGNSNEKGEKTFATAFCLTKDCENDDYVVQETLKGLCAESEIHVVVVKTGNDPGAPGAPVVRTGQARR
jgi:hypothetical protein